MTLGANLERDRLTAKARRVRAVIVALRRQAGGERAEADAGNRHILRAISEFETELASIDARLRDLEAGVPPRRAGNEQLGDWTTS